MPNSGPLDESLQFSTVYEAMDSVFRENVVSRALGARGQISTEATNALNSAIQKSRIRVTGYRDSHRAPHPLLREPVSQAVALFPELAGAVLRAWAESQQALHDRVAEYLPNTGMEAEYPDFSAKQFRGHWAANDWHSHRDNFIQNYEDDVGEDDVGLMLCYVTGRAPARSGAGAGDGVAGPASEYLDQFLSYLKALPPTAPEWRGMIPNFIESVSGLIEQKEAELKWADDFDEALESVRTEFGGLLTFFEQDTQTWAAARVSPQADTATALRSVERLLTLLDDYQAVHERAPSLSEERERVHKRDELQPTILETIQEMDLLMTEATEDFDDVRPPQFSPAALPARAAPELELSVSIPAQEQEATPATSLQEALTVGDSTHPGSPRVSEDEFAALQSENQSLHDDTQALSSENRNLRDEVELLKAELYESQEMEESWRLAYMSSKGGIPDAVADKPREIESVNAAVEAAKERFKGQLTFAPNSESEIEGNPFIRPEKVWEALQWLATTYYKSRMGQLRVTNFDQSIKEACGWWYKGDQGETTMTRYRNSYTTHAHGRTYQLAEHIGKGTNFDARYTIRIAFNWDDGLRRVIVGYIGRHQQTDAS